jgi:hypothetical protein
MKGILGEKTTDDIWYHNGGNPIWLNPKGTDSQLYKDIKRELAAGDDAKAHRIKSLAFTENFIAFHGDWTNIGTEPTYNEFIKYVKYVRAKNAAPATEKPVKKSTPKEFARKWNFNNKGFAPKDIFEQAFLQDAKANGIRVRKAKNGSYFLTKDGKFFNPWDDSLYQLESLSNRPPSKELNTMLREWATKHGIDIQSLEEFTKRLEESGITDRYESSAIAVADVMNKLILVSEGKADITTLPEEIAHFAVELLENDPSVKRALEIVDQTEEYQYVKKTYSEVYNNDETKLRKETLGKLIGKSIVGKFEEVSPPKGLITFIKTIIDKLKRRFSRANKNGNFQTELEEITGKIAEDILAQKQLETDALVGSTEVFYQKKEKPQRTTPEEKIAVQAINMMRDRLIVLNKRKNTGAQTAALRKQIAQIERALEDKQLEAAVKAVLNTTEVELFKIYNEDPNNEGLLQILKKEPDLLNTTEGLGAILENIRKEIAYVQKEIGKISNRQGAKELDRLNTKADGTKRLEDFEGADIMETASEDVTWWRKNLGGFKNSRSPVLKIIGRVVKDIISHVHRYTMRTKNNLLFLQENAEKAGLNTKEFYEKDANGNRTGFIISDYHRQKFNDAKSQVILDIKEELGYEPDEFMDKGLLNKEQLKVWSRHWTQFYAENTVKEVKREEIRLATNEIVITENIVRVPNHKYTNHKFKKLMQNPAIKEYYDALIETKTTELRKLPISYHKEDAIFLIPQIKNDLLDTLENNEKSFMTRMGEYINRQFTIDPNDTMFGETRGNSRTVPIFFNSKLEDMSTLTYDITTAYAKYAEMAENFKEQSKVVDQLEVIKETVRNRQYEVKGKRYSGVESNEFQAIEEFVDFAVLGKEQSDFEFEIWGKKFSLSKIAQRAVNFIRTNNLAFNVVTQTAGYMKGSMDAKLEDMIGRYTTNESKLWARTQMPRFTAEAIAEMGARLPKSKMSLLFQYNDVMDGGVNISNRLHRKGAQGWAARNVLNSDIFYTNYKMADFSMKGKIMLAIYDNNRLYNGKFYTKERFVKLLTKGIEDKNARKEAIKKAEREWRTLRDKSLFNAYESVNGDLVIKDEWKEFVTEDVENTVRHTIKHLTDIIDGVISPEDKGALSRKALGDFVFMHRGWLVTGIENRLKYEGTNIETGEEEIGYYRAAMKALKNVIRREEGKLRINLANYHKLSEAERLGTKKALLDLMFINLAGVVAAMFSGMAAEADDDDYAIMLAAYIANRTFLEANAFANPKEFAELVNKPFAGADNLQQIMGISDIFDGDEIKRGPYKGWSKRQQYMFKRTMVKHLYELQYPEEKNKFVKQLVDPGYISFTPIFPIVKNFYEEDD